MALNTAPPPLREAAPPDYGPPPERQLAERRAQEGPGSDGLIGQIRRMGQQVLMLARDRPELAEAATDVASALTKLTQAAMQSPEQPTGMPPDMPQAPGSAPTMGGRPPMA